MPTALRCALPDRASPSPRDPRLHGMYFPLRHTMSVGDASLAAKLPSAWPIHSMTLPLSWRHKMSSRPSPLKSPVLATSQLGGHGVDGRACGEAAVGLAHPLVESVPLSWRHNMSSRPSPLKSPVPATDQLVSTL